MSWFKRNNVPKVEISGSRFAIVPEKPEIIDVEAESANLPALRKSPQPAERPEPRQGTIPAHSWGA
jgi:hypothetical protein